jgi:hypothetical protein
MKSNSLLNPSTGEPLEVFTSRHPSLEPFDFNAKWGERYTIGLDLGQSRDSTAIAVVRKVEEPGHKPVFQVGNLIKLPLGTTYPDIVSYVTEFVCRPRFRGKYELVIDFTGVGRPVFDMFRVQGLSPIGVCFTAGTAITNHGFTYSVPKGHLISGLQSILYGQLKIRDSLPDVPELIKEIEAFQVDFTDTGHMRFNARSGAHDDLIMAIAIAVWRARGDNTHAQWMDYMMKVSRGGWSESKRSAPQARVKFQRPPGSEVTNLTTITGRSLLVDPDGTIELSEDDAIALLLAGWTRVESL